MGEQPGPGCRWKKTIALHHWLLYYSFAGFLLLLLWNPVFKPVAFQKAPPVFFRHFGRSVGWSGPSVPPESPRIACLPSPDARPISNRVLGRLQEERPPTLFGRSDRRGSKVFCG